MTNRHISKLLLSTILAAPLVWAGTSSVAVAQSVDSGLTVPDEDQGQGRSDDSGSQRQRSFSINPYIEIQQVLAADLSSGGETLTYSGVAVGLDSSLQTRSAEAQLNVRYERRFFYDDDFGDEDIVSGVARGSVQVVPNLLSVDAGGIASRTRVDLRGVAPGNTVGSIDNITQVYSVFGGPSLSTQVAGVDLNASYRIGYTAIDSQDDIPLPVGQPSLDIFDDSVSQSAEVSAGQQPGRLPFGWSVGAGYDREDTSQLDQRLESKYVRADVTVPVTRTLAAVGGIGYEDVEVSERDAVRDVAGDPVVGADGRFVTDETSPRLLSFDTDGIIWDAGVLWKPNRRTSLEARVGRRFGSTTYQGSLTYQPNDKTSFAISAYDTVAGFGGNLNDNLANLPTQFQSSRNPLSGELNGCAFGESNALCFNDALNSVASSTFRARGVTGQLTYEDRGWQTGLALGYVQRRFFNSELGALAEINGVTDRTIFANAFLGKELGRKASFNANIFANYLDSGIAGAPGVISIGGSASYNRQIIAGLSATAAAGLDYFDQEGFGDALTASALLGLRYDF